MKNLYGLLFLFIAHLSIGQEATNLETLAAPTAYENVYSQLLYENEEASYFVIWIKNNVKMHKHIEHTEAISVIDGTGLMTVGDNTFEIKKGTFFTIPKDTFHALTVTSETPVKVISIQMPKFNPSDRIFNTD